MMGLSGVLLLSLTACTAPSSPDAGRPTSSPSGAIRTASEISAPSLETDQVPAAMRPCFGCHREVVESYLGLHAMARSLGPVGRPEPGEVRNPLTGVRYQISVDGSGGAWLTAEAPDGGRRRHRLVGRIGAGLYDTSWVGAAIDTMSGRDTGRLFFAPVETVAGRGVTLSPFELHAESPGMGFALTGDCLTCHTTDRLSHLPGAARGGGGSTVFPPHALGSRAFDTLSPLTCEACHGETSKHLEIERGGGFRNRGEGLGLARQAELSAGQQRDVCGRCHLQGDARLELEPSLGSQRPLAGRIPVLIAAREVDDHRFVGQLERLAESPCYRGSPQMTCTTCHLPHAGVAAQGAASFDAACSRCHDHCSRAPSLTVEEVLGHPGRTEAGCVDCHMPRDQPFDLPHIDTADHHIRRYLPTPRGEQPHRQFADPEGPLRIFDDGRLEAVLSTEPGARWRRGVLAMGLVGLGRLAEAAPGFAAFPPPGSPEARQPHGGSPPPEELVPLETEPLFHYLRGIASGAVGDVEGARRAFSDALALDPDFTDARMARARLRFELGDFPGVVEDTEALISTFPRSEAPWDLRAFLALRLGNPSMALTALETSTQLWPGNPAAWRDLGRLRSAEGRFEEARAALDRARALEPSLPGLEEELARLSGPVAPPSP